MKKAIFLDRDGVINVDILNYTWRMEDFKFLDGVFEACLEFQNRGFMLIIITNQGGIARGLYSHHDVEKLHRYMKSEFSRKGITIDDIYYCPHYDATGKCLCRKPGSLLVEKALAKHGIDPTLSYFIGDRERDTQAGEAAEVKGILVDVNDDLRKTLSRIS
jgi:D-glycero-D-manno-heptose 1,7-bisphosphate phosphatase